MVRIMTWNCLGMEDQNKRQLLTQYCTANDIDFVFLQEGSATFTTPVGEANSLESTLFPDSHSSLEPTDKQIVGLAFQNDATRNSPLGPRITGMGGVSRKAYYNSIGTPVPSYDQHASADYVQSQDVRKMGFRAGGRGQKHS